MEQLKTIRDLIRWAVSSFNKAQIFYGHGNEDAMDEAHHLILPSLHLSTDIPESLYYDAHVTKEERELILKNIALRTEDRMPVAYITKTCWFAGLKLYIDQRALIPRSPIAELIQQSFSGIVTRDPLRILDLCTGSGCIAVACGIFFPGAQIDAIDFSESALQVAQINIEEHDLLDRVFPIQSDLFEQIPNERYDLIVANPPYEAEETLAEQAKEYQHEPPMAFLAEDNGLAIVKKILYHAKDHLTKEGVLVCEVGKSANILQQDMPHMPFHWINLKNGGSGVFAINKESLESYYRLYPETSTSFLAMEKMFTDNSKRARKKIIRSKA